MTFTQSRSNTGKLILKVRGDFFAPNEKVSFWFTDRNRKSFGLGEGQAGSKDGVLTFELDPAKFKAGETYFIAGRGARSGVVGLVQISVKVSASQPNSLEFEPKPIAPGEFKAAFLK